MPRITEADLKKQIKNKSFFACVPNLRFGADVCQKLHKKAL